MKKIIQIMSIFLCTTGYSQITYNSTDYAAIADSFHVSKASTGLSSFDFAQTGVNFTWNYGTLPVNQQRDIEWFDPVDGGYQNAWCASNTIFVGCVAQFENYTNLAKYRVDSLSLGNFSLTNVVDHYNKTTAALEYKMQGATINIGNIPVSIPSQYIDTDTIYNFPLNYADQDSSTSKYEMDLNTFGAPFRYVANRERINIVEGWGSLTTPFGNFASVLKVKTIIRKADTIYTDSLTIPVIDTLVEYKWFDAAYGIPVLQADGNYVLGTEVITGVTYIDDVQCIAPTPFFAYNPLLIQFDTVTNSADVNFINLSSNADSSHWDFGDGITSVLDAPTHTYYCPGVYMVDLHVTNQFCIPDSTDSIALPVIVLDTNNRLRSFQNITMCDSANMNGNWYTTSQIVVDTIPSLFLPGCDSLIVTILQITTGSNTPETATVCSGGSYTFPDGTTQTGITSQVIYTSTFTGSSGCDSLITSTVDVYAVNNANETVSVCEGGNYTYPDGATDTGLNTQTIHQSFFTGTNGCDSTITTTVNVTIIDATITTSNDTLLVISGYDGYQWYVCSNDSLLSGETSNSLTPMDTLPYYVEITEMGCTDISACEVASASSIYTQFVFENIALYPNPVSDVFTLEWNNSSNVIFEIIDMYGVLVEKMVVNNENKVIKNISYLSSGIYFVSISSDNKNAIFKIVKL